MAFLGYEMSGRITALKIQQRNLQRVNVFLDDEFAFGLARITAAWLQVGQELSDQKIAELLTADALEIATQKALHYLEYRQRSEHEIRCHLDKHGVEAGIIEEVLARLRRNDLVNDENFAKQWVENRSAFRPRSRKALAVEMRRRGIDSEAVQAALMEIKDEDEEKLAYQAAQKQARKLSQLEWSDFRRKLGNFLARRGFSYDTIVPVTERVWQEQRTSDLDMKD